jgi:hypothetical protein
MKRIGPLFENAKAGRRIRLKGNKTRRPVKDARISITRLNAFL